MSLSVVITGTGNPAAHPTRAGAGVLVRADGVDVQIDAGRATTMRLAGLSGDAVAQLAALLLTHHHSDHVVGVPDLLMTHWLHCGQQGNLPVVGPDGPLGSMLQRAFAAFGADLADRVSHRGGALPELDWRPFALNDVPREVWAQQGVVVQACAVDHHPLTPAVGYRVSCRSGTVAVSGDTRVCEGVAQLARGADVLVHEALLADLVADRNVVDYHTDAGEVGALAVELDVPVLVLTHLIPAPDTDPVRLAYVEAVRGAGYRGELHVADDLLEVTVP